MSRLRINEQSSCPRHVGCPLGAGVFLVDVAEWQTQGKSGGDFMTLVNLLPRELFPIFSAPFPGLSPGIRILLELTV